MRRECGGEQPGEQGAQRRRRLQGIDQLASVEGKAGVGGRQDAGESERQQAADHWTGGGDQQLVQRPAGGAHHYGDTADRQQDDLAHRDAEAPGDQAVTQLVQHDTGEQRQHQDDAEQGSARAVRIAPPHGAQQQDERKREMDPKIDAGYAQQAERASHGQASPRPSGRPVPRTQQ